MADSVRNSVQSWRDWHWPLSRGAVRMGAALDDLAHVGAGQDDIPFIVQLMENPRYDIPGLDLIHGAVDLSNHDAIHVLLGRGLLQKDEAFVIGFTMGSTRKVGCLEEKVFTLVARHLYPGIFRFTSQDVDVFQDGVRLAWVCRGQRLDRVDFGRLGGHSIADLRQLLGVDEQLLAAYYRLEKSRYPHSPESARLLD